MERRKALALSAAAVAVVVSGTIAIAATSRSGFLGFGGASQPSPAGGEAAATAPGATPVPQAEGGVGQGTPSSPQVVTQYEDVVDRYVVRAGASPAPAVGASAVPSAPAADPSAPPPADGQAPTTTAPPVATTSAPTTPTTVTSAPTTTAPRSPTTTVATTATTRPPGVPSDWPADKPIPPMPAGCRQPQLDDNGTWNCQH